MIAGIFHQGSGLGDQLFRYIGTKVLAEEKGFEHAMVNPNNFKGASFMELPLMNGMNVDPQWNYWFEKEVRDVQGTDIRSYDPEINFIEDNTIIDGSFEDDKYWGHNLDNIRSWLTVGPLEVPDDVCVIGFRGGEYTVFPDLFLTKEYWEQGIKMMREINPKMRFEIHTDDGKTALNFFEELLEPGEIRVIHHIGMNWRSVRYAKYLLIANSAFYILPALLNENVQKIIAPRYWARRNIRTWARPACYYRQFHYI